MIRSFAGLIAIGVMIALYSAPHVIFTAIVIGAVYAYTRRNV